MNGRSGGRGGKLERFPFTPRQVAGFILLALAVVFILQNRRKTLIRFIIPDATAPLWLALLISVVVGIVAGALLVTRRRR